MKTKRILIAEDEKNIRVGLVDALESEGYKVVATVNGRQALNTFNEEKFSLAILDIMMPEMSGYEVCRQIRKVNESIPIIFLSAKAEEIDKVLGLELGADDYVTKPFGVRELLARVAAALRRAGNGDSTNGAREETRESFPFGMWEVDGPMLEIQQGKERVALTPREYRLLCLFHSRPNEALSRDLILNEVWGIDYLGTTRTLDQHMAQLRKKIERDPASPKYLHTVHGHGYRYRPAN